MSARSIYAPFIAGLLFGCGATPPRRAEPSSPAGAVVNAASVNAPLPARPTPRGALLALAKRDHTLAIVDPTTLEILAKIPVGDDPHEVVASADGRLAYVSNYGGGAFNTLAVVDLVHQKALPSIDLGPLRGPHGLVARGGKIWFTAEGAKAVGRYDPPSQKVDWALGTGQDRTHMLFVSEDLKHVITTNVASGTVSFLDVSAARPEGPGGPPPGPPPGGPSGNRPNPPHMGPPGGNWEQTVVPVGHGSEGFDVSPDGKQVWVANAREGTVSVLDDGTEAVTQTLNAEVPGANRLKFTLDGKSVFVSSLGGGSVAVLDVGTRQVVKRIPVGHGAAGILMQPGGARAYVACSPDDYLAVIDLKSLEVVGHVDVGHEPDGLAWAAQP